MPGPSGTARCFVTPHGTVAVVEAGDLDALALHDDERAHLRTLSEARRGDWALGRAAIHTALADDATTAILVNDRGAPRMPAGWVGSISHKHGTAAALVARAGDGWVGVDLERAVAPRVDLARRILTPREVDAIGAGAKGPELLLRFALKEAIYKAIDPTLRRYVAFTEVELDDVADGTCRVRTQFAGLAIDAAWRTLGGYWLATARARGHIAE